MKALATTIKWTTAAALLAAMTAAPAWAEKTTPATDKNSAVPAVPRAIPDLIPYHKFDPPKSKLFDINKLTISGDLRVRPEFRNNTTFGNHPAGRTKVNSFFVQQWARLGFNYSISPDVTFFFQPQYSKNWGVNNMGATDANGTAGTIFARQGFMLIRNFLVPNLTVKAGRQLVVWGNHRMFGHFDWNNVGWAHDGLTANYKINKMATFQVGWLRTAERNCRTSEGHAQPRAGGCIGGTQGSNRATDDGDVLYVRAPMKVMGLVLEPAYIWHSGGTGGNINAPRPRDQTRHTVGGRAVKKMPLGGARLDATIEGYYQFGKIGQMPTTTVNSVTCRPDANGNITISNDYCMNNVTRNPGTGGRTMDIAAYAFHFDAGVTLPVPMQPRLGIEYNTASGNKGDGKWRSFDQLYPTNHIHFGYMDRMSWKNMNHYSAGLQLRPNKDSHFEVTGHFFSLKEATDGWYHAGQGALDGAVGINRATNTEKDIGKEIDVVYTHFFTPGNHVGWQIGGGVFFPGERLDMAHMARGGEASKQTWGYTQLWINF